MRKLYIVTDKLKRLTEKEMENHSEFNDFDDFNHREEWDEDQWEKFFQKEDEHKRRLEKLLDKYGYSEQGLLKAFEEMGYKIEEPQGIAETEPDENDDEEDIEDYLAAQSDDWLPDNSSHDQMENAHPLFRDCYNLILKIMKMLRYVNVRTREHPVVTFQSGLFECMSKLIRAGYDDIDYKLEAEHGLILAALKRSRKALFLSLLTIPEMDKMKILSRTTQKLFRHEIMNLLKRLNAEIILQKNVP
jgi:hypothetical protein